MPRLLFPLAVISALALLAPASALAQAAGPEAGGGERPAAAVCASSAADCVAAADRQCRSAGGFAQVSARADGSLSVSCAASAARPLAATPGETRMCTPSNPVCTCSGNLSGGYGSVHVCMVNAFTSCISAGGTMAGGGIIPDGPDSGTFWGNCVPRS